MNATELKAALKGGALDKYRHLYADLPHTTERIIAMIDRFTELYGDDREIGIFSVPGRSEISGNHTDHNHGCVLAGAIDRDIIAIASPNTDGVIRFRSEGYPEDVVDLSQIDDPKNFPAFKSLALVAGIARGFQLNDYAIGGYDAYSTTEVLKGSGISSSAAFEVMVGNVMNYFYNDGKVGNDEIAKMAQYSENVFFGKPCGLMDQMACAVGGFVFIDFEDPKDPVIEPIDFSLSGAGYALCIVNTGGNHADLNADYASVPAEMKAVAAELGKEVLRGTDEATLLAKVPALREKVGDRAILRAFHFIRENERVPVIRDALKAGDIDGFLAGVIASGNSSFKFLQNVFTTVNVAEQGLSLALAITEGLLAGKKCAWRVHGGGFAGTIQVFLPEAELPAYCDAMNAVFGKGAAMPLRIRPAGACRLF